MSYVKFPPGLAAPNTFIVSQQVAVVTAMETASCIIFYHDRRGKLLLSTEFHSVEYVRLQ